MISFATIRRLNRLLPVSNISSNSILRTNSTKRTFSICNNFGRRQSLASRSHLKFQGRCFSSLPDFTPVTMPALSPTMEDGAISSWLKKEGDEINVGEVLCEIETDKATVDFELTDGGYLAKILVPGSDRVKVGELIAVMVENEEDCKAFQSVSASDLGVESEQNEPEAKETDIPSVDIPAVEPVPKTLNVDSNSERVFISPIARKNALEAGVSVEALKGKGTGLKGRVVLDDVLSFLNNIPAEASTASAVDSASIGVDGNQHYVDLGLNASLLAANLAQSKQEAPHYHLIAEIDLTKVLELRDHFKQSHNVDVSVNDFFIKASSVAMKSVPVANASFRKDFIRVFSDVNVNLFTNDSLGLIRDVHNKGLTEIAAETEEILSRDDNQQKLELGTFSVLNLGSFGVRKSFPIVPHGQSACLAIGEIYEEYIPLQNEDGSLGYSEKSVVNATFSCDHRVVDGAVGAQWLQKFKALVEDPSTLLL